jgi:hypothetical protein
MLLNVIALPSALTVPVALTVLAAIVAAHFIAALLHHGVIHLAHAVRDDPSHGLVGSKSGSTKRNNSHENQSLHLFISFLVR